MYYEINVALNGKHFFATAQRSIRDEYTATLLFTLFREKFPEIDGYKVTCTQWSTVGTPIQFGDLIARAKEGT